MNAHRCAEEMWLELLNELVHDGSSAESRVGGTREKFGWSGRLINPLATAITSPARAWSPSYAAAELLWYVSGKREIDGIVAYAPSYENYANAGQAMGAYGHRWRLNPGFSKHRNGVDEVAYWQQSQIHAAVKLLKDKPSTRQAVVSMWDSGDVVQAIKGEWKDLPCTIALQFRIDGGALHAATFMRSNDAWKGFPYDVFCFTAIQRAVAASVGLPAGEYVHMVGSMHLYDKDIDKAKRVLMESSESFSERRAVDESVMKTDLQQLREAVRVEELGRQIAKRVASNSLKNPMDHVTDVELKWLGNVRALDCHAMDLARLCWRKLLGREASDALIGPVGSDPLRELADRKGE